MPCLEKGQGLENWTAHPHKNSEESHPRLPQGSFLTLDGRQ